MRSIPLGASAPVMHTPLRMVANTRAPYWSGKGRVLCAVPSTRLS